jgi:hypothetical protein
MNSLRTGNMKLKISRKLKKKKLFRVICRQVFIDKKSSKFKSAVNSVKGILKKEKTKQELARARKNFDTFSWVHNRAPCEENFGHFFVGAQSPPARGKFGKTNKIRPPAPK